MKNKLLLGMMVAALLIGACKKSSDFLENKSTALTEEMVFTDSIRTMSFLTRIYADMAFSFSKGRWDSHGNTEQATDDAEYNYSGTGQKAVVLYNGTVSPTNFPMIDFWQVPFVDIRRANLILENISRTPMDAQVKTRVKAEARFLRAWFYNQLLISFGGVPIVGDRVFEISDLLNLPRNNWSECVDYVVKELDTCATILPQVYVNDLDYGRVTKGACLALKSRVLVYAASPLFNGGSISTDPTLQKIVSYPVYDVKYWEAAAKASLDVMNSGNYSLLEDNTTKAGYGFYSVFLQRVNPEYILAFHRAPNRDMEGFYNPPSRGGAKNSQPTQNLVDAFPMANGLLPFNADGTVNIASGYDPQNPYLNRDPRFGYSIIYNGSKYFSTSTNSAIAVNTYAGAATDGFGIGTNTGYFSRKMCDSSISANSSANSPRGWPLIRFAEILLNYAEAVNETGQTALAYDPLIKIRKRAGIIPGVNNLYGLKPSMTIDEMREIIRNERRVELAFEDHRWHDIRRWKIAMKTNNQYNKVMSISNTTPKVYTVLESIRRHNFRPEMYLLPIPDAEIRKMPAMLQNPGW